MKTAARRSPADRDRAVARLRRITIGTSFASLAAVGGFGAIAAHSYDGTSVDLTTAAAVVTADVGTTTDTTGATTDPATTSTTTTVQATAAPTTTTGTAHAATGSS